MMVVNHDRQVCQPQQAASLFGSDPGRDQPL
jgi:hypothetical protein